MSQLQATHSHMNGRWKKNAYILILKKSQFYKWARFGGQTRDPPPIFLSISWAWDISLFRTVFSKNHGRNQSYLAWGGGTKKTLQGLILHINITPKYVVVCDLFDENNQKSKKLVTFPLHLITPFAKRGVWLSFCQLLVWWRIVLRRGLVVGWGCCFTQCRKWAVGIGLLLKKFFFNESS